MVKAFYLLYEHFFLLHNKPDYEMMAVIVNIFMLKLKKWLRLIGKFSTNFFRCTTASRYFSEFYLHLVSLLRNIMLKIMCSCSWLLLCLCYKVAISQVIKKLKKWGNGQEALTYWINILWEGGGGGSSNRSNPLSRCI